MNGEMYGASGPYPYQHAPLNTIPVPNISSIPVPVPVSSAGYGISLPLQCGSAQCHGGSSPHHHSHSPMGSPRSSPGPSRRSHVLPPCKVCTAQATGFHYGVNTCEACKGFFRRSLLRKEEYICLKSSKCVMQPGKRNLCGFCRYQKCLEAGMSKEGIKTGRYTYEKRTKDILELKQIKKEVSEARNQGLQQEKIDRAIELADRVMQVRNLHTKQTLLDQAMFRMSKYLEEKHMLEEFFGDMKPVTDEDYIYAFENMGLELDNRRDVTLQLYKEFNEQWIPEMFSAARDSPGAEQISNEELSMLFKHSACDFWILARHRLINPKEGCATTLTGITYELSHIMGTKAAGDVLKLVKRLQGLQLRPAEVCILMALSVYSTDRCEVKNRQGLEQIQDMYLEALEVLLPVNHPSEENMLAKVLQVLVDLRSVSETIRLGLRQVTSKLIDFSQFPLVHHILFS